MTRSRFNVWWWDRHGWAWFVLSLVALQAIPGVPSAWQRTPGAELAEPLMGSAMQFAAWFATNAICPLLLAALVSVISPAPKSVRAPLPREGE